MSVLKKIAFAAALVAVAGAIQADIIWSDAIDYPFDSGSQGDLLEAFLDVNLDSVADFQFRVRNGGVTLIPLNGSAAISSLGAYTPIDEDTSIESDAPEFYEGAGVSPKAPIKTGRE